MSSVDEARENGISSKNYYNRVSMGWNKERAATKPIKSKYTGEYAVYRKGEIIVTGTAKECAEFLGTTEHYIRWMTFPSSVIRVENQRNPEMATTAVKLD